MRAKFNGRSIPVCAVILLGATCWVRVACAQQLGAGTGVGGGTSTRSITQGSGRTASGAFGTRSLGSGANQGSRSLASGMATRQQDASTVGQLTGNERFLRGNRQGQFVGADTQDMANFFGALAGGGRRQGGMGSMPGLMGMGASQGNDPNAQGNRRGEQRRIPARVVVSFEYRGVAPGRLSAGLIARLTRVFRGRISDLDVQVDGRIAVLRGEVATERDRVLAERLALLEAGISEVQNELLVRQGPSPAEMPSENPPAAGGVEGSLPELETAPQTPEVVPNQDS